MALTAEQKRVLGRIKSIGKQVGASPKQVKAAIETGLVESNLTNPAAMTDHDSQGWRQERASLYPDPTNLDASIKRFYQETAAVKDQYGRAGDLAAAVQRPAAQYRGRYQQRSGEAASLIGRVSGGAPVRAASSSAPVAANPDPTNVRGQLIAQFLSEKNPDVGAFATSIGTLNQQAAAAPKAATPTSSSPAPTGKLPTGVGSFEGKKVAAWIVPALTYARAHGWKGTVTSGYRSFADQQRIYDSGVRPAAKPGTSNHEGADFPRGAVDATDAATLSRILKASPYASKLIYAGSKDNVHFSHPHGGSYLAAMGAPAPA